MSKKLSLIVLIIIAVPSAVMASGFGLYDANAKATGMGSAFVAKADDASAIYYNPAGIAFLEGHNFLGSITPVQPHVDVTFMGDTTSSEQRWVYVPSMYYATSVSDRISVGIGVFAPFGLGVQYPAEYPGNLASYRSMGLAAFIRPTVAFKVSDNFAIGGGVDFVYSRMKEWRRIPYQFLGLPFENHVIDARYEYDGTGTGFAFGALYKASEQFQIGLKYRHKVEIDYEGDVDFTFYETGVPMVDGMIGQLFVDQGSRSGVTIPNEFTAGIMYKTSERLSFTADFVWTKWSEIEVINLLHDETPAIDSPWPMEWEDTWQIKFGTEYWVSHSWAVRGGYIRDNSPIPAENLTPFAPDSDRNEFTVGLGYDTKEACCWGRFFADAAFRYILLEDVTSEFTFFPAEFSTDMTFFAISFGVSF